ncbi:ferredoxin [Streptomyces spiroverticillatus]|uniref:Ferredoxin n=1 Tax=Streptomyces finlayi TaxID=67296 RepID=A0A919CA94_9ACTN|nr:ferredoxin [Streptomyces spiroverticillatus]GHC91863.1 ferredoxin [Streptomyces finlayi]
MTYVIAQPCVDIKDRACLTECPVDCIYEGVRTLYINPDECVDCHACEPVCPVEAIFQEDELPQHWEHYRTVDEEFFDGGSAQRCDPREASGDHPLVAALPPQQVRKTEISRFAVRKDEADDVDPWFPL